MWGMTDTFATPPAPESPPPVSGRLDASDAPWPLRPWIMAAICEGAGLIFHLLVDRPYNAQGSAWRDALAAFVAISSVGFVLGVVLRRWTWAAGFAAAWDGVLWLFVWYAGVGGLTGSVCELPFC